MKFCQLFTLVYSHFHFLLLQSPQQTGQDLKRGLHRTGCSSENRSTSYSLLCLKSQRPSPTNRQTKALTHVLLAPRQNNDYSGEPVSSIHLTPGSSLRSLADLRKCRQAKARVACARRNPKFCVNLFRTITYCLYTRFEIAARRPPTLLGPQSHTRLLAQGRTASGAS
jgi:hypothetical protein